MIAKKLKTFLDQRNVKYVVVAHSPAYTAQEIAASVHVPGQFLAKTVMVEIDGALAMAVLPANQRVLIEDLRDITETEDVHLAHESEFREAFPDCEPGAMPPFGNLYDMSVYVSPALAERHEIVFSAGSHHEVIKMAWRDYEQLVKPHVVNFTM
ncbi:YbaK/EbsC family protein [Verrucomicrobium sp. BvORR034]|uniref:aminoacyl-tRNA deacylase n=1 Tax=Verrucomicrobium sp. BvORR034 TaxID=1396418 RepID=UPI0006798334|nr:YbaK/EbsC family protein [Verrucomicrobium sp. BvORR034]